MNIYWNRYFDHIFILTRAINHDKRKILDEELKRVGIEDYHYWYNCDSELMDNSKFSSVLNEGARRCTFGYYHLIKTCYELGYDNVLILEDDIVYLQNTNLIEYELERFARSNADIYLFDYIIDRRANLLYLTSNHYVNRRAMKYLIYCIENYPLACDNYFCLKYLDGQQNNIHMYFYLENSDEVEFKIPAALNILPLMMSKAATRVSIQRNNIYYSFYNNNVNLNLYNITDI